jgi:hypothetical protein
VGGKYRRLRILAYLLAGQCSADRGMTHTCHALGCTAEIPPALFMCKAHWYKLPKSMRDAIWATYRAGQEIDKRPKRHYVETARAAIDYVAQLEGKRVVVAACLAIGCSDKPLADAPMCARHWSAIPHALRAGIHQSVLSDATVQAVLARFPGAVIVDVRGPASGGAR